jgi:hypothetical protein
MRCSFCVLTTIALASLLVSCSRQKSDNELIEARTSERILRDSVRRSVPPTLTGHTSAIKLGVAVASIRVGQSGKVSSVTVIEAPDKESADAVRNALLQWVFAPPEPIKKHPVALSSLITFYFVDSGGRQLILAPHEAPFLGKMSSETDFRDEKSESLMLSAR